MFDSIRAALREPLLHFLLGGAGLFLLFGFVSDSETVSDDQIVVTSGQIEHMVSLFLKTRKRMPSDPELHGLIDDFILEEVLYRQAVAIGLERDDTIIRRRLRQKMDFLLDDFSIVEPTDADLQQFLDANSDRYRSDARISFEQVHLKTPSHEKADAMLAALQSGEFATPDGLSDSHLIPRRFDDVWEAEITAQFGKVFGKELFALEAGRWAGPVESPFGVHLIRVDQIVDGQMPTLDEIRGDVKRDWLFDHREVAQQGLFDQMRAKYSVTIETYEAPER